MLSIAITFCIYLILFAFWSDLVLGLSISGVKGLSITNASIYTALILWCIVVFKRKKLIKWNEIFTYLSIMFFIGIISIPIKILNPEFPRVKVFQEIINLKNWSEGFIFFVIIYNLLEDRKLCIRTFWALLLFFLYCNITMLLDWYGILNFKGLHKSWLGESSGFGNPNDYAAYMLLFFPVLFSAFLSIRSFKIKFVTSLCILVSILSFILTGSRGGFVSLILGSFFYFFLLKRYLSSFNFRFLYIFLALVLLTIPVLFLPKTYVEMQLGDIIVGDNGFNSDENEDLTHGRRTFWIGGLKIFMDSPIYGHGLNSFPKLLKKKEGIIAVAHNKYLQYLAELGLIGFFSYLMLQFSLFKNIYSLLNYSIDFNIKIIFINYLTGFLCYSMALFFYSGGSSEIVFWIYSASVIRLATFEKENIIKYQR